MNIHPFPARRASDLALRKPKKLQKNSVVLDPMAGSGTVVQAAYENGHRCIGMDVDPLAILMTKVATGGFDGTRFDQLVARLMDHTARLTMNDINLPWFDQETEDFSKYWFASEQRRALRKLSHALHHCRTLSDSSTEADALRIVLSKLIITKESGASLARDVSHSRPHRVIDENDFDVSEQFFKSAARLRTKLIHSKSGKRPIVRLGDARRLPWVRDSSVDMIMTSPPYLNAIDYMRGHRLSLIWLGYSLTALRQIRSDSIGAERGPDSQHLADIASKVRLSLGKVHKLPARHQAMINRYAYDLILMMQQAARVLKPRGQAVFVIGNSCLQSVFISNASGIEVAAKLVGLKLVESSERKLPSASRYLPMPSDRKSALGRRMRTETVLTFRHRKAGAN